MPLTADKRQRSGEITTGNSPTLTEDVDQDVVQFESGQRLFQIVEIVANDFEYVLLESRIIGQTASTATCFRPYMDIINIFFLIRNFWE